MYKKDILLVDGYNIIHGWDSLKKIADYSLEDARVKLIEILRDYQGSKGITIIIVFDSHYVKSKVETIEQFDMLKVVYTKEAESADNYIEKITGDLAKIYRVTVATSDYLEQIIVIGKGAIRISAREFEQEVKRQKKIY